jgi:hypothetical protein
LNFHQRNFWSSEKPQLLEVSDDFFAKASKMGLLRYTISKIWNKTEAHKLCFTFEYKDDKSYKDCQKFIEQWAKTTDKSSVPRKAFANRGVIIADYNSD